MLPIPETVAFTGIAVGVAAGEGASGNVFQQLCIERAFELLNAADAKAAPEPPQP